MLTALWPCRPLEHLPGHSGLPWPLSVFLLLQQALTKPFPHAPVLGVTKDLWVTTLLTQNTQLGQGTAQMEETHPSTVGIPLLGVRS